MSRESDSTTEADSLPESEAQVDVLLVDDDETWATTTARLLEHQRDEVAVETAFDLAAASTAFADGDYDCVVCDYWFDDGTGLDLLAEVREAAPDLPFVLITGQGSEAVASDAITRQVTDYVPKRQLGGRDDVLARRIETAVESYRTRRALAVERRSKDAMLDILRASSSRDELAREFCDHLVREREYDCAWIGTVTGSNGVVPQAVAGDRSYVDAAVEIGTTPEGESEPAFVALRQRELHAVTAITATEDRGEAWRTIAEAHGIESAAAVPIRHDGAVFGVLAVYRGRPGIGSEQTTLLREYGETIGYALRSAEWKESLLSTAPVGIEIELADDDLPLVALDRHLPDDSCLDLLTAVTRGERLLYVIRAPETDAGTIADAAGAIDPILDVTVTRSADPARVEVAVEPPTPAVVLASHGGRVVDATVERGRATIRALGSSESDVGTLVAAIRDNYPDAGVRSVGSVDALTRDVTVDDLLDALTDRQRQALELAYYNGYFERPREHNTTEVAEKLGVSRATFTQHLRAGENKVLSALLGADGSDC